MKIEIILLGAGGVLDRQTIEVKAPVAGADRTSIDIHEALKAWELAPGDTITIREVS